jgi:hypothetical protein
MSAAAWIRLPFSVAFLIAHQERRINQTFPRILDADMILRHSENGSE